MGKLRIMIRATLGVIAAIVAMVVVVFLATKLPDKTQAGPVGAALGCLAGGCVGTFVGRTRWSGWIAGGRFIPVPDKVDLDDLQRAFE